VGKGNIIGQTNNPNTSVASGVWTLQEHLIEEEDGSWPYNIEIENTDYNFDAADGPSYTYSNQSIGAASDDRLVIVMIHAESGANVVSCNIGGSAATDLGGSVDNAETVWGFQQLITTGTTTDVEFTLAQTAFRSAVSMWTIKNYANATLYASNSTVTLVSNTLSCTLDVPDPAVGIVIVTEGDPTNITFGSGIVEEYDENPETNSTFAGGRILSNTGSMTVEAAIAAPISSAMACYSWR
jgi:hypothetical protein